MPKKLTHTQIVSAQTKQADASSQSEPGPRSDRGPWREMGIWGAIIVLLTFASIGVVFTFKQRVGQVHLPAERAATEKSSPIDDVLANVAVRAKRLPRASDKTHPTEARQTPISSEQLTQMPRLSEDVVLIPAPERSEKARPEQTEEPPAPGLPQASEDKHKRKNDAALLPPTIAPEKAPLDADRSETK